MKVVLRPSGAYYGIYRISEIREMFKVEALERIFLMIDAIKKMMEAVTREEKEKLSGYNGRSVGLLEA